MKVRVKVNVQLGEQVFQAGEVVEIDDETAKASPWAFEPAEEPKSENESWKSENGK